MMFGEPTAQRFGQCRDLAAQPAFGRIGQYGGVLVPDDQRLQHGASQDAEDVEGNCRSLGTTGRFWAQKSLACRTRRSTYEARGVAAGFGSHALVTASRTPLAREVGYSHVSCPPVGE